MEPENENSFVLIERKPTAEECNELRKSVGWGPYPFEYIKTGLRNSSYAACVLMDNCVVGMTRVVGDGATCFYIQDVIVRPEFQKMGMGTALMEQTMKYIEATASRGAVVGLMSAKGKEEFYEKFGFWKRPVGNFGYGMMQFWGL